MPGPSVGLNQNFLEMGQQAKLPSEIKYLFWDASLESVQNHFGSTQEPSTRPLKWLLGTANTL